MSVIPAFSGPDFEAMAAFVAERTGLVFGPSRYHEFEAAVRRCMKSRDLSDLADYRRQVAALPDLHEQLVSELTVGETYFFRHREQFDFLRDEVLPSLSAQAQGRPLRLWSAGCASGEEPYSLAILLDSLGALPGADILGTDLSRAALARARTGHYRSWSLRGDESALAVPYLDRHGHAQAPLLTLAERIRAGVRFAVLNLAGDDYPSPMTGLHDMDVIFCRNVLIYFEATTVAQVAARLFQTLAPGGWLFTSPTDPPLVGLAPFDRVTIPGGGVVYRRPAAHPPAVKTRPAAAARPLPARGRPNREPRARRLRPPSPTDLEAVDAVRALLMAGERTAATARALTASHAHPLSPALQHLVALTLFDQGRLPEAEAAIRRALYLDPSLALAHLASGSIARAQGDRARARRAFRNALALTEAQPPDAPVPLGEGETAGRVAALARQHLAFLETVRGDDTRLGKGKRP